MLIIAEGCMLLIKPLSIFDRGTVVDGRVIVVETIFPSSFGAL